MRRNLLIVFLILFFVKTATAAGGPNDGIPFFVVYQAINIFLLVCLLTFLTRKKIMDYIVGRAESHQAAKQQAKKAVYEAEERHKEVSSKLKSLTETETQTIEKAQSEAMEMKSKLIREAEALATRMVEEARRTVQYEEEKAKQSLRKETFELAMAQVKNSIQSKMTAQDQKNLQKNFIDSIGTAG